MVEKDADYASFVPESVNSRALGRVSAGLGWDQAAYVVAFVVAIWTRRMLPSLAAGMAAVVLTALVHP